MNCIKCGATLEESVTSCPFCRAEVASIQNNSRIESNRKEESVTVTMYLNETLKEQVQMHTVPRGTKMDSQSVVDMTNQKLGMDLLSSDGKSFYVKVGGFEMEFAWYYRGTNEKFAWNTPIMQNIELEMKMNNGQIGNSIFQGISNLFH